MGTVELWRGVSIERDEFASYELGFKRGINHSVTYLT